MFNKKIFLIKLFLYLIIFPSINVSALMDLPDRDAKCSTGLLQEPIFLINYSIQSSAILPQDELSQNVLVKGFPAALNITFYLWQPILSDTSILNKTRLVFPARYVGMVEVGAPRISCYDAAGDYLENVGSLFYLFYPKNILSILNETEKRTDVFVDYSDTYYVPLNAVSCKLNVFTVQGVGKYGNTNETCYNASISGLSDRFYGSKPFYPIALSDYQSIQFYHLQKQQLNSQNLYNGVISGVNFILAVAAIVSAFYAKKQYENAIKLSRKPKGRR